MRHGLGLGCETPFGKWGEKYVFFQAYFSSVQAFHTPVDIA